MSDFEVMPIGTKERLAEIEATAERLGALETYARQASDVLAQLVGNNPQLMTVVAGERLAHPIMCAARIEGRIRNAGRRYRPFAGPPSQSNRGGQPGRG